MNYQGAAEFDTESTRSSLLTRNVGAELALRRETR